ncbi:MAG: ADP-ribosylglycohydrolase family protein [Deltaproteobacteria bacterium]|nr:ADP-ribosylglycohydrolase family protein [Deltaproteobacteria bacterium]
MASLESQTATPTFEDRLAGTLIGTALGDALGLPVENLTAQRIELLFGRVTRFRFLGRTGFVSDDTEHTAFVAQALIEAGDDPLRGAGAFARRLKGWVLRAPFGVGFATLRACLKLLLLFPASKSGVRSAGNGAAMRSAILGAFFAEDASRRTAWSEAIARVTHTDPRAVQGAGYVAALAAQVAQRPAFEKPDLLEAAKGVVEDPSLLRGIEAAQQLAEAGAPTHEAAKALGVTGFVVHTVPFAAYALARWGDDPRKALEETVNAGGDTDTTGAIVGALLGTRHGLSGLPQDLIQLLEDGPLGRRHLLALAHALASGVPARPPGYSALRLLARNLLLIPVIFGHVAWRMVGPLLRISRR